ncbi:putative TRAP-type C4-dicarboxylate transport system, small permease component [Vibrio nigripulchritudo MADA3029]|uniref:TRAP transporter small permease protein n=3 Tax=Vibrio nigripulchritudo TaxID=28173 RepID=U4K7B8_9VIBR|nr:MULTISPECIES: TRAP transporter small permease [Vibrio]EGU55979.1 tripartite ATP-independent periplasmic transporter DctQ [Vibrio nigripulchritudo ATCC 27043]UAB69403.1 TRAP transporter small permease [Vibrio sp. SCSIO 43132]CCN48352.1 putative TRAP-type C4-dicarboxylate transport system, small permease component [Vibrio nigripulchritudo MADA3020]CCN52121.1 putative TRAP-type C4-dicarboxylate transport system, small permease component [Vibrio nigripulchritudo MADA3021]CCN58151.1 putative TRA
MEQSFFSRVGKVTDNIEETLIALFLGGMTLLTFANVVFRYVFNDNILWALELTVFLFAWMVLVGASYGVKKHFHIGVDVVINLAPESGRKIYAIIAVSLCLLFSVLLFIGSWNYWYPFVTERAWYETDDIPMPEMLQFLSDWMNEGERYEKMPRFIPYAALPIGMALLTFRFAQAAWQIITGKTDRLISSHEAEEDLEALKSESKES